MAGRKRQPRAASSSSRRRPALLAALLVVIVVGLLFFLVGGGRGPRKGDPSAEEPGSASSTGALASASPRAARPGLPGVPPGAAEPPSNDPGLVVPGMTNLPSGPPPYPPGSQPLTEGVDPAMHPKDEVPISPRDGITCIFGPRVAIVHPPDPMVIDLEVHNSLGALMPIGGGVARFRPDKSDPKEGPWFEAQLVDDGSGKDLAPGDRRYTATFLPGDPERAALFKGGSHVFVEVAFEAPQGLGPRRFPTVMEYSREPHASLTGSYSDNLVDGSLVVGADVTATETGDYRLIGSLYAAGSDHAIAFASKTAHLDKGRGTIPLLFFGKILHDAGYDGRFDLRYEMLFEESPGESIAGDTVDHAYTTRYYSARDFSGASYVAPAPTFANVDRNSPSQQGKPGPLLGDDLNGPAPSALPTATVRAAPDPISSAK